MDGFWKSTVNSVPLGFDKVVGVALVATDDHFTIDRMCCHDEYHLNFYRKWIPFRMKHFS